MWLFKKKQPKEIKDKVFCTNCAWGKIGNGNDEKERMYCHHPDKVTNEEDDYVNGKVNRSSAHPCFRFNGSGACDSYAEDKALAKARGEVE